jgi:hypothetical protein
MLLLVALAAVGLGGMRTARRRAHFRERAAHHVRWERNFRYAADHFPRGVSDCFGILQRNRKLAAYQGAMRRKYERATHYPFLSVAPDPPETTFRAF